MLHAERLHQSGVPLRKLVVIANAPDPRIFPVADHECPSRRARSTSEGAPFSIICHGTITRRLGLDTAIAALSLLHERFPLIRLRMIGAGDYLNEIKTLSRSLGVESAVSFEKPVPIQDLAATLREANVGLVPNHASSATHLMLPVKLLEYVALGIPVICARLRTVEHYFSDRSLRFFSSNNAAQLAAAIQDLYLVPALGRNLSNSAANVVKSLSWPVHSQRFCDAVDSLLKTQEGSHVHSAIPLVVGLGEVGGALAQVLKRTGRILEHDIKEREFDEPVGVMHICFPFTRQAEFEASRAFLYRALQA